MIARLPAIASALLVLALAAGCAPAAHLSAPAAGVPAAYDAPAVATPASPIALDRWWGQFGDAQLESLVDEALAHSTTARAAYARLAEARAQRAQQRAATLPSGSLSGSATEQGTRGLSGTGQDSGGQASYALNLYPSWEVDLFGRLAATRAQADATSEAASLDYYGARLALAGDVAAALFQARYLARQLEAARDTQGIADRLAASATLANQRGLTSTQDLARLQTDAASAAAEVIRLGAELHAATRSLLILVGRPNAAVASLPIAARLDPPPALPALAPGDLLLRRPDVLAAERNLRAAALTLRIDRLALFPRISIQPGIGLVANGPPAAGATAIWSIAAGLTLPVLDRPRLMAAMRVSQARGEQSVIAYERAVQTAYGEAENALVRLAASQSRLADLTRAEDRARFAFDAAQRGYAAGLSDLTTLLQTERTWLQARSALDAERYAALADTVTTIRALGGGWDPASPLTAPAPLHTTGGTQP